MVARLNTGFPMIGRLRNDMDRLFDRVFDELPRSTTAWLPRTAFPAVNVWEDEDKVFVEAELPGIKMDDLEVSVIGNELTLKGERGDDESVQGNYHRRERGVGAFTRVLHLPVDIDVENVGATLRNGVLTITLPKAEVARPRKVEVRTLPK